MFDELSFTDEYFVGFEVINLTAGIIDYYFDEIKLLRADSLCNKFCSDHESECKVITMN